MKGFTIGVCVGIVGGFLLGIGFVDVCGGQLRELTWMRTAATGTGEALCTACGAWVEVLVTPDGSHRVSALTLLRLVREMLVYDAEVPTGRVQGGMAERFARLHRLLDSDVEVPAT